MYQCKYCGKEFDSRFKVSGHASRCKMNPTVVADYTCSYCGKVITGKHSWTQHQNHCESNPEKKTYNNTSVMETSQNCKYCGKSCKNSNSLRNHERLCSHNPDKQISGILLYHDKIKDGEVIPWNKGKTKETDARIAKQSNSLTRRYKSGELEGSFKGKKHKEESKLLISAAQLQIDHDKNNRNSHGKRGWLDNMFFMSTWELAYYLFMRDTGHSIIRCPQKFDYVDDDNKSHTYTPDFLVDDTQVVEIKGYETDHDRFKYTLVPGLVVIGEKDISPYLNYVYKTYQTRDLETLYDMIPKKIT